MKHFIQLVLLSVVLCLPMLAIADNKKYEIDGIWYIVNLENNTAEVTSGDENYTGEVSIPYQINVVDGDLNGIFPVTRIGEKAFKDCKDLTRVGFPKGLESIGREAFKNCVGLESINLYDSDIRVIGESAFWNCKKLRSVLIPCSVSQLSAGAFYGCSGLETVVLETESGFETNLDTIGEEAFAYCPKAAIEIPEGVRVIGAGAFLGNEKAVWYLPHSLEVIESKAFQDCPVTKVYCYATKPPMVGTSAFDNPQEASLFVPYADRYRSADVWKDFGTIKQESLPEDLKYKPYSPTIEYADGELHFSSMDENVSFSSSVECEDAGHYHGESVSLSATYHIRAEASNDKCSSDITYASLCWIDLESKKEDISTSVGEVKGMPILVEKRGETVTIKGATEGMPVHIYSISGQELVSGKISGPVTSFTALNSGAVIVIVGDYSIKIIY